MMSVEGLGIVHGGDSVETQGEKATPKGDLNA